MSFKVLQIKAPVNFWLLLTEGLWDGEGMAIDMRTEEIATLPKISRFYTPPVFLENDADIIVTKTKKSILEVLKRILESAFYSTNSDEGSFTYTSDDEVNKFIEKVSTALYIRDRADVETLEREDLEKILEGIRELIA